MTLKTSLHDGRAVLYHGDCMDILPSIPSESVDAVITDPPYIMGAFSFMKAKGKSGTWADIENAARWFALWMGEAKRTLKPTGYMFVFGNFRGVPTLVRAAGLAELDVVNILIWDKERPGTGHAKQLRTGYELALVCAMPEARIEDRSARDVIRVP